MGKTRRKNSEQSYDMKVGLLIEKWKAILGLGHWTIRYETGDFKFDTAQAEVKLDESYFMADIRVKNGLDDDELEPVVLHELFHCVLGRIDGSVERILDLVGSGTEEHAYGIFSDALEPTIESLVRILLNFKESKQ